MDELSCPCATFVSDNDVVSYVALRGIVDWSQRFLLLLAIRCSVKNTASIKKVFVRGYARYMLSLLILFILLAVY